MEKQKFKEKTIFKVFSDPRHRQIVTTSAIVILFFLVIFVYQFYRGYQSEIDRAEIIADNTTQILEEHFDAIIENADLALIAVTDIISERGPAYPWTSGLYYELLRDKISSMPEIAAARITNSKGEYLGQNDTLNPEKISVADRDYFQYLSQNPDAGLFISKPVIGKTLKVPVITLSRRLNGPKGEFLGIVFHIIRLDYFKRYLDQVNIGEHSTIAMVSLRDRILMARSKFDLVDTDKPVPPLPILDRLIAEGKDHGGWMGISKIDNLDKVFSIHVNPVKNFYIVTGLATADFLSSWRKSLYFTGGGILLLLIGFVIGLYRFLLSLNQIEQQRVKATEASKLSVLGEMAGGVAHEINNPLAIIQSKNSAIRMMLEMNPQDLTRVYSMLEGIDQSINRVAHIVSGLRTFAKVNGDEHMQLVPVERFVAKAASLISERMKAHKIDFRVNPIPQVNILCHESEMLQVLISLISNSFDAIVEQAEGKWIEISFEQTKSLLKIFVTDSGPGIPKDISSKIMNPFFTTKEIGKGTGLGLTTSKSLIENYGGRLYLNENSENTQFVIELKVAPAAV